MNIARLSENPSSAATRSVSRASRSRSARRVSRSAPREIRQATKAPAASSPIPPRQATNGNGSIPAS